MAVLRIQLILMRIRIRIMDPHWKKMDPDLNPDPDPGYFYNFFLQFLVDILPLGSQNLADPTDSDPKHWFVGTGEFGGRKRM